MQTNNFPPLLDKKSTKKSKTKPYRILIKWNDDYHKAFDFLKKEHVKNYIAKNYKNCKEWTFFENGQTDTKAVEEFNAFMQWLLEESIKDVKISVE